MGKTYKPIPPEVRSQILLELAAPGYNVAQLAKAHQVSTSYIYNLQKIAQVTRPIDETSFIEPSVKSSSNAPLKKASLTFANCSLLLEGEITSEKLIAIINILEEQTF